MKCEFLLDVVQITLRLNNYREKLVDELSDWMKYIQTIPAYSMKKYQLHEGFKKLSVFDFKPIKKVHLIHDKRAPLQNIDALLVLHDVPLYQFLQIEAILKRLQCVDDYNISFTEFRWDFYPMGSAIDLQQIIIQRLFLKNARYAFNEGEWPRITYYVNSRANNVFMKVYIRPKKERTGEKEYVRVELSAKRNWLKRVGLMKPSDFKDFEIEGLLDKIMWLDIDQEKIKRSYLNLYSGGLFAQFIDETLMQYGIAKVITENRKLRECPEKCPQRADINLCPLAKILKEKPAGIHALNETLSCSLAKPIYDFATRYCFESEIRQTMDEILKNAYEEWKMKRYHELVKKTGMKPIFQIQAHVRPLKKVRRIKKEPPDFKMTSIWRKENYEEKIT